VFHVHFEKADFKLLVKKRILLAFKNEIKIRDILKLLTFFVSKFILLKCTVCVRNNIIFVVLKFYYV